LPMVYGRKTRLAGFTFRSTILKTGMHVPL
jgi:hypothetical protein